MNSANPLAKIFGAVAIWCYHSLGLMLALGRAIIVGAALVELRQLTDPTLGMGVTFLLVQAILLGWMIIGAALLLLPIRHQIAIRPAWFAIDLLVCANILTFLPEIELLVALCLLLLGGAVFERLGKPATILFTLLLASVLAFRHLYQPVVDLDDLRRSLASTDIAILVMALIIGLLLGGEAAQRRRIRRWGQRLQAAGGTLVELPRDFLLTQIMDLYGSGHGVLLTQDVTNSHIQCAQMRDGAFEPIELPPPHADALMRVGVGDWPFLFALSTDDVVRRSRFGGLTAESAADMAMPLADLFAMRRGLSFPIHAANVRGRIFVAMNHSWSANILDEAGRVEELVEGFFERFFFLQTWRQRAFAEARLAMSRDLHDSVLQTLAALRIRAASLKQTIQLGMKTPVTEEIAAIEELITMEQRHLRALVQETDRTANAQVTLAADLQRCAALVQRQWDVECTLVTDQVDVMISQTTALEVEFLMREIIANAVQHAGARRVVVAAGIQANELMLSFRDAAEKADVLKARDENGEFIVQSRSLLRRLSALGGAAYFDDLGKSSLLSIRIPLAEPRRPVNGSR